MRGEFYLCGLTYSALERHKSTMKTCDHVSSSDKKRASGSYFVMWAGQRHNVFCLCGLRRSFTNEVTYMLGSNSLHTNL